LDHRSAAAYRPERPRRENRASLRTCAQKAAIDQASHNVVTLTSGVFKQTIDELRSRDAMYNV
jgi:hypothetical protein